MSSDAVEGRLVLVVEDNAETADTLRRILMLGGYRVVAAYDGLDALEMLRSGLRPAAIVLDLAMPNMDGAAFRTHQLTDPELVSIPVVVYSAHPDADALPGIVAHVRKGTDNPDVLLGAVEAACRNGRPRPDRAGS